MKPIGAIIEIAGADAFAAAAAYTAASKPGAILPTYVHTGTEYGDFTIVESHIDKLRRDLADRYGTEVLPMETVSDPELWRAINGRFMTVLRDRFGFFSPCIGCHLYLHLMRLPVAQRNGTRVIVSGERENHLSGAKINQTPAILDAYSKIISEAGFELAMPVRKVTDREGLLAFAPWLWEEGGEQMKCVLSGNYRDANGKPALPRPEQERLFIKEFLIPAGRALSATILSGSQDYNSAVAAIIGEM
jgi:hypothetical protein